MKKRLLTVLAVLTGLFLLSTSIVWAQVAPVEKTGQTTSYQTGDDGYHQKGIVSPNPRFTDNSDGTVTDNLTGLMWAKDANMAVSMKWEIAIIYANSLSLGNNSCGSSYTDWRLPNVKELQSLIDYGNLSPALPTGHHFSNVQTSYGFFYWSSTTFVPNTNYAWAVHLNCGAVSHVDDKTTNFYVWPVRGGN